MRLKSFLLLGLVVVLFSTAARAGLTFVLTPAVQSGARSNEVVFTGILSNTSLASNLFLNDIQVIFVGAETNFLTADTNTFFANVPGILLPGETYSDVVFGVTIKPATPPGDYFGSVSVLGGSNIFAAANLSSQTFQVSSPAIRISATNANAYRFGAQPGSFAVTRIGATNVDLAANFLIGGTAGNGVDYSSIANSITIPAGSVSATITVAPLETGVVEGDRTVVLTLLNAPAYNLAAPTNATVTIHDTPFNAWRLAEFGTNANNGAVSGDFADPDGDGIVNLLEYALNLNPSVTSTAGLPAPHIDPSCGCLTITYTKVIAAIDLIYSAEAADAPGGPWSTNGITQAVVASDSLTQTIQAGDAGNPISTTTNRFMHLKIARRP